MLLWNGGGPAMRAPPVDTFSTAAPSRCTPASLLQRAKTTARASKFIYPKHFKNIYHLNSVLSSRINWPKGNATVTGLRYVKFDQESLSATISIVPRPSCRPNWSTLAIRPLWTNKNYFGRLSSNTLTIFSPCEYWFIMIFL